MVDRVIKVRAWDTVGKQWLRITGFETAETSISDGYTLDGVFHDGDFVGRGGIIVTQYTGLKDRNGREIYEGDIIEGFFDYEKNRYEIVFGSDACYYGRSAPYNGLPNGGRQTVVLNNISDWAEVIGNIFEHPHLLGGNANGARS